MSIYQLRNITKGLVVITLVLVILGFIYQYVKHFWDEVPLLDFLSPFNLNKEENIPATYSALLLLLVALLLMRIAILRRRLRYCLHWVGLSVLFAYLSFDEATAIHENMKQARSFLNLDANHVLYNDAWIFIGIAFVGIIGLLYFRFLWALPKRLRTLFLVSAGIYIVGALGMEIVGGCWQFFYGKDFIHTVFTTIEELLEMLGVVLFIDTLLPIAVPKLKLKSSSLQKQLPLALSGEKRQKINRF